MEKYDVTGMTCAACAAHVEKAVRGVDGVEDVAVSLLTNSMSVSGTAQSGDIIKAVQSAGYGASPQERRTRTACLRTVKRRSSENALFFRRLFCLC